MGHFDTNAEYYEWALKNHPSVIRRLAAGEATMTKAPDGFMWFGDEGGEIEVAPFFLTYATKISGERTEGYRYPLRVTFGQYELEYCGLSENGSGKYRRVDTERIL